MAESLINATKKKILFNLEPIEIAKLLEERSAMLHSTKEGIVKEKMVGEIFTFRDKTDIKHLALESR